MRVENIAKKVAFFLLLLVSLQIFCQTDKIQRAEYFIDTDPGGGNGMPIGVTSLQDILTISDFTVVGTAGLSEGSHQVGVRVQDEMGFWSMAVIRSFYIDTVTQTNQNSQMSASLVSAEYFLDSDPGGGNAFPISFNETSVFSIDDLIVNQISSDTLSAGSHQIGLRVKDSLGRWSSSIIRSFYIDTVTETSQNSQTSASLISAEYFLDSDPGGGNAFPISFNETSVFSIDDLIVNQISSDTLSAGSHQVGLRVKDSLGRWSTSIIRSFYVDTLVHEVFQTGKLIAYEYVFDNNDISVGTGNYIVFNTPKDTIDNLFEFSSPPLAVGGHQLTVRVKDEFGNWSHNYTNVFEVCLSPTDTVQGVVGDTKCTSPSSVTLKAIGSPTGEYVWFTQSSGGTPIQTGTDSLYSQTLSTTTRYFVAAKGALCNSNRLPVDGIVIETFGPPSFDNIVHCGADTFNLSPSGSPEGGTYKWYATDTSTIPLYRGDVWTITTDSITNFYIEGVTRNDECISTSRTSAVIVVKDCRFQTLIFPPLNDVVFQVDFSQKLTAFTFDPLTGDTLGFPIHYEIIEGESRVKIQGDSLIYTGLGVVKIKASQEGDNGYLYYKAIPQIVTFTIVPDAQQVAIVTNSPVCEGELLTLSSTPFANATYEWVTPSGQIKTGRTFNAFPATLADTGKYKLIVRFDLDTLFSNVTIKVNPGVTPIHLILDEKDVCAPSYDMEAIGGDYASYNWYLNGAPMFSTSIGTINPVITGVYHVIGVDENECTASSSPRYVDLTPDTIPEITLVSDSLILRVSPADSYQWYVNELFIVGATTQEIPLVVNGIYKVISFSNQGCKLVSQVFEIDVDHLPSIDVFKTSGETVDLSTVQIAKDYLVYPNPTTTELYLISKHLTDNTQLEVYDLVGHLLISLKVVRGSSEEYVLDVSQLQVGTYILRIQGSHSLENIKFLIQR
jgi:hypothetical protein